MTMKERKYNFKKEDAVIPEGIPFKEGDVIAYIDINTKANPPVVTQKNIIILKRIRAEQHCDIFGTAALTIAEGEKPYIEIPADEEWSRVWHNHDKIRPATWFELLQFSRALVQAVKAGKTFMEVELPKAKE